MPLLARVCLAPRRTMRWMLDHPERRQSFAVVVAAMLSYSLGDASPSELSGAAASLGLSTAMLVALLILGLSLLVSGLVFFAFAGAATAAGQWLGGSGSFGAVRTALAWGLAPQVWALFYRVPFLLLWPEKMGRQDQIRTTDLDFTVPDLSAGSLVYRALQLAVLVWYLVVGSQTLAEAQGFSSWRGLANLLMAMVLPVIAIMVIVAAAILAMKTT